MSTQGMVTVTSGGKVVMKIVAGCDGYEASDAAAAIKRHWPLSAKQAYDLASEHGLGCQQCRVAMSADEEFHHTHGDLNRRYRKTFSQPEFNPRWDQGTLEHFELVEV